MDDAQKKVFNIGKMNLKERWFSYLRLTMMIGIISMISPIKKLKK
jgi:hypothetical protein